MRTVSVNLEHTRYDVHVGPGLLDRTGELLRELGFEGRLAVITDSAVRRLHGNALERSLSAAGFTVAMLAGPDRLGEVRRGRVGVPLPGTVLVLHRLRRTRICGWWS